MSIIVFYSYAENTHFDNINNSTKYRIILNSICLALPLRNWFFPASDIRQVGWPEAIRCVKLIWSQFISDVLFKCFILYRFILIIFITHIIDCLQRSPWRRARVPKSFGIYISNISRKPNVEGLRYGTASKICNVKNKFCEWLNVLCI